jgi:hypothetical protein
MKTQREVSKKKRSEKRMKMSRGVRDFKMWALTGM